MMFSLEGKTMIVTGAAGQLGGEYVRALLAAGAFVVGLDIADTNPKGRLKEITSDKFMFCAGSVIDRKRLESIRDEIIAKTGRIDGLINNAAIDTPPNADNAALTGPFESYPEDALDLTMDVNINGTVRPCQVFGGHMAQHGGGSIVNISSIYGILSPDQRIYRYKEKPFFKAVGYSVSKSGILNLTRYLATYWAEKNVRVNTMTLAGVFNNQDEQFLKNYCPKVPLGRMAKANEYNGAAVFLLSDASSYMTGSNMVIDGGFSAW